MTEPFRIAIAGLGTVGGGVARMLRENASLIEQRCGRPVVLAAYAARSLGKVDQADLAGAQRVSDALELASLPQIDAVAELIGGADGVALELTSRALAAGRSVVSANKAMIANHGADLARLAQDHGVALVFEAAVAGGIPVLKIVREALAGNRILSLRGILNGTCNYILTRMETAGLSFEAALGEAQALGYAEADPSADIDGLDAAHKLAILSALAFGFAPDLAGVARRGLRGLRPEDFRFAADRGYRIKLIGAASYGSAGLDQWVQPCLVPADSPLAQAAGVLNAIQIEGNAVGPLFLSGRGAGAEATASAVLGDLTDLARGAVSDPFSVMATALAPACPWPPERQDGRWYLRLLVQDGAGALAAITGAFAVESVSIETVRQDAKADANGYVFVYLTTHLTNKAAFQAVIDRLSRLSCVHEPPFTLRIDAASSSKGE